MFILYYNTFYAYSVFWIWIGPLVTPQNTGRGPCKFPSQQLKQSLSLKLSYVRSHVSVCDIVRPWLLSIHSWQVHLCVLKHMALIYDPRAKEQGILSWPQFYWLSQACFVVIPINWMRNFWCSKLSSPQDSISWFSVQRPMQEWDTVWHCDHRNK